MTTLLRTRVELDAWLAATTGPRGVVLTMGALHEGHEALMHAARAEVGAQGTVLVTIFVNPTQFAAGEDFERYPRSLDEDLDRCIDAGVDAVFAPEVREVYPDDFTVPTYEPGPLANELEGAARPGHFAGVLTVVARLLLLTHADVTCFGEKDFQQLTLVRRLIELEPALAHCRIVGVPIVRDDDGLALSSRNQYLTDEQREQALAIPACLRLVGDLIADGVPAAHAERIGRGYLATAPGVSVDYVVVRSESLGAAPSAGPARVLIAATVGATRLLDNGPVEIRGERS